MPEALLSIKGLRVAYGGIMAVKGIDFEVRSGELVSLIGANGAGKTTTLKAITGMQPISDGDIVFDGRSVRGKPAHELVRMGLAMVPEGRGVFTRMTIDENLLMGAYTRGDKQGVQDDIDRVFSIFPRLKERRSQLAGANLEIDALDGHDAAIGHPQSLDAQQRLSCRLVLLVFFRHVPLLQRPGRLR